MSAHSRHSNHDKYKTRIESLIKLYTLQTKNLDFSIESHSHNAKYIAVLVSGYLEQAVKELTLGFASRGSRPQISRYIQETWPISKNMNTKSIHELLDQFNSNWAESFVSWLEEVDSRKGDINSIVTWRNSIAHGQESNTTGVTLVSVRDKFLTVKSLVDFLETTLLDTSA